MILAITVCGLLCLVWWLAGIIRDRKGHPYD